MLDINIPFTIMMFICGVVFGAMPVWAVLAGRAEDAKADARYWRRVALENANDN